MSNLLSYPLVDGFETTLSQSWDGATGAVNVNTVPTFTFPASTTTYIVVNPGKSNMQVAKINAKDSSALTLTVSSITVNKGASSAYTQQSHAVGSKVIISDSFAFWEDIATAINSKLDNNGGNPSTTFDLDLTGSAFRIRKDGNNMKFTDDNQAEVSLSTLAAAAGVDDKVKISNADTTSGYLDTKLTAGDGLSKAITSPAGDERLDFDIDVTDTTIFVQTSSGAGDSGKVARLNASGQLASGFINTTTPASLFGSGEDGAGSITGGTTTLTRDMYYTNLTITSTGVLDPAGYRVFCTGTCLIEASGSINRNGNNGGNGGNASGATAGTAGTAGTILGQGSINGELQAAAGTAGHTGTANAGVSCISFTALSGANGGDGQVTGGVGGTAQRRPYYDNVWTFSLPMTYFTSVKGPASSGGGAGGAFHGGTNQGGGGGGGAGGNGGVIQIFASTFNNLGTITATAGNGGNGGNAAGSSAGCGGGGGGGNGGCVYLTYSTLTNLGTITLTAGTGGTKGTTGAGGTNGANGNTGVTIQIAV